MRLPLLQNSLAMVDLTLPLAQLLLPKLRPLLL
jgi:hypothetical protein